MSLMDMICIFICFIIYFTLLSVIYFTLISMQALSTEAHTITKYHTFHDLSSLNKNALMIFNELYCPNCKAMTSLKIKFVNIINNNVLN